MNKFFGKKGQGAMEYLMTYGWAILVVMIVGVVLWQLGIFNLGGTVSKTMSGFTALKPLDWTITSGAGGDSIVLVNGEGTRVGINTVTILGQSGETCTTIVNTTTPAPNALSILIEPGNSASTGSLANGCSGTSGSAYKLQVSIAYNKTIGTVTQTHTSVGTLRGTFE